MVWHKPIPQLWESPRTDFSWTRCVQCRESSEWAASNTPSRVLAGFASSEGVARNRGRIGAHLAPPLIRQSMACLPHLPTVPLIDIGDFVVSDELEAAQTTFATTLVKVHQNSGHTIVLGGGHETAWAHYQAISKGRQRPVTCVNFDAHLDVRPLIDATKASSGTPYRQILEHQNQAYGQGSLVTVGFDPLVNSPEHTDYARSMGATLISAQMIHEAFSAAQTSLMAALAGATDVYISIDMDVINGSMAPGVSAVNPLGLFPHQLQSLLIAVLQQAPVVAIDIVEYSPPHDHNQLTQRLCASLLVDALNAWRSP